MHAYIYIYLERILHPNVLHFTVVYVHTHTHTHEIPRSKFRDLKKIFFPHKIVWGSCLGLQGGKKPNDYKHAMYTLGFSMFYPERWQDFKFVEHYAGFGELTNTMREVHGPSARLDLQYHRGHDILTPAGMA